MKQITLQEHLKKVSSLGGQAIFKKKGSDYFRELQRKGVAARRARGQIASVAEIKKRKAARVLVHLALQKGVLKKGKCFCGSLKVEAHHEDYSKPLAVKWLCKKHHIQADLRRRKLSPL